MARYALRRLLEAIPVFLGVVLVVFLLYSVVPGDPARLMAGQRGDPATIARIRADMGLDKPIPEQFADFLWSAVRFDLGRSYRNNMQVMDAILQRVPATLELVVASLLLGGLVGIVVGIISAIRQNTALDYTAMTAAVVGISAPTFWIGMLLILFFALELRWIPGTGYGSGRWVYLVLPTLTLATRPMALLARITRSSMLEAIRQDFVRTARAKGLSERVVVIKHALRNALIPVVTVLGTETAAMLGGVVVTETVFSWPGLGRLFVEALLFRDYPIIRGQVLFLATVFIAANLLVDLSYAIFDPRIRYD
ncbi:ABC transporter permease [Limnochorda pilosa]|uniref:Glutathione ABC transporter permease n=1 Tax=Limnochorda pilosa TaxID=1555112 RepID=A0A0K2SK10_LIMPI|nr:ABC transporter permease [Limnochorda pilosa]BAS27352.1 glutathione ABC transporter permease [Limnochorda pilosa]